MFISKVCEGVVALYTMKKTKKITKQSCFSVFCITSAECALCVYKIHSLPLSDFTKTNVYEVHRA